MRRSRTFTASGAVVDAEGSPVENVALSLVMERVGLGSSRDIRTLPGGRFEQTGLPPGEYAITAVVGASYPGSSDTRQRQFGRADFRVDAADVSGLVVTLSKGATLAGRIATDDVPLPPGTRLTVETTVERATRMAFSWDRPAGPVADDFTFRLTNVFGPAQLIVRGLPRGWVVQAVRAGTQDITDRKTEFAPGRTSPVEIVLTGRAASLTGTVLDERGAPVESAAVALVPIDEAAVWSFEGNASAFATEKGTFEIAAVRPGEYWVAAIEATAVIRSMASKPDPTLRARIVEAAQRIRLGEGERRSMELQLVKLPDER